jgi:hypothetical protein
MERRLDDLVVKDIVCEFVEKSLATGSEANRRLAALRPIWDEPKP